MPSICSGVMTVDPVVVSPLMASKQASTGDMRVPVRRKGKAPAKPPINQLKPTTARPSRR